MNGVIGVVIGYMFEPISSHDIVFEEQKIPNIFPYFSSDFIA